MPATGETRKKRKPWDQGQGYVLTGETSAAKPESEQQHLAFITFCQLLPDRRSWRAVADALGGYTSQAVGNWAKRYNWRARCKAWEEAGRPHIHVAPEQQAALLASNAARMDAQIKADQAVAQAMEAKVRAEEAREATYQTHAKSLEDFRHKIQILSDAQFSNSINATQLSGLEIRKWLNWSKANPAARMPVTALASIMRASVEAGNQAADNLAMALNVQALVEQMNGLAQTVEVSATEAAQAALAEQGAG